jgi:hypothetical protein
MTALAQGVQRPEVSDLSFDFGPQKGGTVIFMGGLIMVDPSSFLRPAAPGVPGAFCVGVAIPRDFALDRYDNSFGADGALTVQYKQGPHGFQNDGANPILSTTQPGTPVFAVDDQTVSLSSLLGTRPFAGRLRELDPTATGGPVVVEVSKAIGAQLAFGLGLEPMSVGAAIASAAIIAPTAPVTHITGTAAIATINAPPALFANGGQITLIPDGAFTTTTAGNIALASTAVVGKALIMTLDPIAAKWYPSY